MTRLRRADCSGPGIRRRRRGRGFGYVDAAGKRIDDPEALSRIAERDPAGVGGRRVFDAFAAGLTIRPALERVAARLEPGELPIHQPALEAAVLDLLNERVDSGAVEQVAA